MYVCRQCKARRRCVDFLPSVNGDLSKILCSCRRNLSLNMPSSKVCCRTSLRGGFNNLASSLADVHGVNLRAARKTGKGYVCLYFVELTSEDLQRDIENYLTKHAILRKK